MRYALLMKFRVTSTGKFTRHYIRAEYAPNTLEHATLFDTLEQAENAADIQRMNVSGYARDFSIKAIVVE